MNLTAFNFWNLCIPLLMPQCVLAFSSLQIPEGSHWQPGCLRSSICATVAVYPRCHLSTNWTGEGQIAWTHEARHGHKHRPSKLTASHASCLWVTCCTSGGLISFHLMEKPSSSPWLLPPPCHILTSQGEEKNFLPDFILWSHQMVDK